MTIRINAPAGMTRARADQEATAQAVALGFKRARFSGQSRVPGQRRTYNYEGVS